MVFLFCPLSVARNSVERSERAASTLVCRPDLVGCESPAPQTTECVLEPNLKVRFHLSVPPKSHSRLPSHNQVLRSALSLLCSVSLVKNDYQSFLTSLPSIRSQKEKQTRGLLFLFARMRLAPVGLRANLLVPPIGATQVVWSINFAFPNERLVTLPTLLRKFRSKRYLIVLNSFPSIRDSFLWLQTLGSHNENLFTVRCFQE